MKTSFSLTPVGAAIVMAAEIITVAVIAMAVLYLIFTFVHSWFKNGSFGAAVTTFEENVVKVGKVFAAPFVAVVFVFAALAEAFRALMDKLPFKDAGEFFAWFAGADLEVWRKMPSPVRKKRTGFGIAMFLALVVTSFLAGRVWGDIFHSTAAGILIGFMWFVLMWGIDRLIIVFMDNENGNKRYAMAALRFVMIIAIAYINTTFVTMEIYSTAIANNIMADKKAELKLVNDSVAVVKASIQNERDQLTDDVTSTTAAHESELAAEQAKVDEQRSLWRTHQDQFMAEVAGDVRTGTSGKKGWGDAARAMKKIADEDSLQLIMMTARLDTIKTHLGSYILLQNAKAKLEKRDPELVAQLDSVTSFVHQKEQEVMNRQQDGYGERTDAMWKEAGKRPFSFGMVMALFFTLESIAIVGKLIGRSDNYDKQLALIKQKHAADHQYAAEVALQQAANDHANTMGALYQQSVSGQAAQAATLKAQMATMSAANVELIKEVKNNLDAINAATAGMSPEDANTVRKSMKREFFQKIGFGVN